MPMRLLFAPILFSSLLGWAGMASAQPTNPPPVEYVVIQGISVEGNKKTRTEVILRELDFQPGDTIAFQELNERLRHNRLELMNTGLFTDAKIYLKNWSEASRGLQLLVQIKENWYVYPFPIFELADRNFNVWWTTYEHSLQRINFGVRFYHLNFTGNRDLLKLLIQYGYTRKYELDYRFPAFNASETLGFTTNLLWARNREINYATAEDRQLFFRDEQTFLLQRYRIGGGLTYRPKWDVVHHLAAAFHYNRIGDRVLQELNPDYFDGRSRQRYLSLSYAFSWDTRDVRPYPSKGHFLGLSLRKDGLGPLNDLNRLQLDTDFRIFFPLAERWTWAAHLKGRYTLPRRPLPYHNLKALGYEFDFVRGYEFYVMDGPDFFLTKNSLRFRLFRFDIDWGRYMLLEPFRRMPVRIHLAANLDGGYVRHPWSTPDNRLVNTFLLGYGLGLDFVVYYDKVFQVEYSRNRLGEGGIFLHWELNF